MSEATVIVLTGPSSTGKSSVALEVQRLAARPTVFLSGDAMDMPPDARSRSFLASLPELDQQRWQLAVYAAFYRSLAAWAANGIDIVGEAVFKSEAEVEICAAELQEASYLVVRLTCDERVRIERERRRGDRPLGTTAATAAAEFVPSALDLEIDTTHTPVREAASLIVQLVESARLHR
jgi:chloramphenicol 3-O phosphotransferase